jgi:hypothetical protein
MSIFLTIISGVLVYVLGQTIVKLPIDPVQEMKRTTGTISHSLNEYANVIANPGVPTEEVMNLTSQHLRKLSAQLESHLYLVPFYRETAAVFGLPTHAEVLTATKNLRGLSNSVYRASDGIYEANAKRVESICDGLNIFMEDCERISKVGQA